MRIAFVMPGIGVVERGAEAFVVELAAELAARHGVEPVLFCRGDVPLPHVRVRALPRDNRLVNALYGKTRLGKKALDTLFLDPLHLEWGTAALSSLPSLFRGGFDVVVMEGGLAGAWVARLLRRLRGVPFVDIAHGIDPKWEGAFARQGPDRVVTFTQAAAEMIRARAPRARIAVIPHGVDLQQFRPGLPKAGAAASLPRPLVLAAGAVDSHKRFELAVEAVARLPEGGLAVLGEGPAAPALDALAARRLGPGRYLRAAVPRAAMPAWYAAADCFTMPSLTESFGLAYLEAMACGLPCVAPDDAVRREVIGEAGVFCAVADPEAYAGALGEA
ncbi:MAG TPA: glycosyltransferase, partial [Thermoanaerobaculia bacterium]|nr:glycosyltransferase [Thermoanaerobaculia bacterium]